MEFALPPGDSGGPDAAALAHVWVGAPVLAFVNGAIRELVYKEQVGQRPELHLTRPGGERRSCICSRPSSQRPVLDALGGDFGHGRPLVLVADPPFIGWALVRLR